MVQVESVSRDELIAEKDGRSEYRAISPWAIVGVLLAAASILALENVVLWVLPLIALVVNVLALRRIDRQSPRPLGRGVALAGAAIALTFAVSAPLTLWGEGRADRSQAIAAAREWFVALRQNQPDRACQWTMPRWKRAAEGESLTDLYSTPSGQKALRRFIDEPAVRLLLKLGKRAHVRYQGNQSVTAGDEERTMVDLYSVTVDEERHPTTFFVELTVKARLDHLTKRWSWEVWRSKLVTRASQPAG